MISSLLAIGLSIPGVIDIPFFCGFILMLRMIPKTKEYRNIILLIFAYSGLRLVIGSYIYSDSFSIPLINAIRSFYILGCIIVLFLDKKTLRIPITVNRLIIITEILICSMQFANLSFRKISLDLWASSIQNDSVIRFFGMQRGFDSFAFLLFPWVIGLIDNYISKKSTKNNSLLINIDVVILLLSISLISLSSRWALIEMLIYFIFITFKSIKPSIPSSKIKLKWIINIVFPLTVVITIFINGITNFINNNAPVNFSNKNILNRFAEGSLLFDTGNAINANLGTLMDVILSPTILLFGYFGSIYDTEIFTIADSGILSIAGIFGLPITIIIITYSIYKVRFLSINQSFFILLFFIANIKGQYICSPAIATSWLILINQCQKKEIKHKFKKNLATQII